MAHSVFPETMGALALGLVVEIGLRVMPPFIARVRDVVGCATQTMQGAGSVATWTAVILPALGVAVLLGRFAPWRKRASARA